MLWKLFGDEKKVEEALRRTPPRVTVSNATMDMSPSSIKFPANNDTPGVEAAEEYSGPRDADGKPLSRLWLEDWSEEDEARLNDPSNVWDGIMNYPGRR